MWYYMQDGAQQGPISEEELQDMARDGRLQPTDMVWKSGMQEWQQANQVEALPFSAPAVPDIPAAPSGVGDYTSPAATAPAVESQGSLGSPAVGYGAGQSAYGSEPVPVRVVEVPNYLVWSILVTLFCCLPPGIAAIVFSVQANSAKTAGNFAEAQEASKKALLWIKVSAGIGIAFTLFYIVMIIIGAMAGNV